MTSTDPHTPRTSDAPDATGHPAGQQEARPVSSGVIGGAIDAIGDVFDRDKDDER